MINMYKKSIRKRRMAQPVSWVNIYHKMMVIVSLYPLLWISWLFMTGVLVDAQRLFNMESMTLFISLAETVKP